MTNVVVRKAVEKDAEGIQALVNELALYEKAPEEVSTSADDIRRFGFGKDQLFEAFVADHDGVIVGFALCFWKYSTWKGKALYLEDFYVKPTYRKDKIGKALFTKVVELAKIEGANRMEWLVLDWNELGLEFYKKIGATLDETWITGMLFPRDFDRLLTS